MGTAASAAATEAQTGRAAYEVISEEDIVRLQWWGLYHDKPRVGYFMMRIKIPGGILNAGQLRTIGRLAERFGRNYTELATRQNVQLHWIRLDDFEEIFETLESNGLTTAGACGDTVRNITSCPVAGIARDELFDVTPTLREFAEFFYGNREYSDLPRKHKITISADPTQCNAPDFHCIALVGAIHDGRPGYAFRVGGGLSSAPR
ncbi:MAG: nitrite/sulfite reductase, partial [Actinobacteria bacterium]